MRIEPDSETVQQFQKELGHQGNLIVHQGKADTAESDLRQQWQTLVCLAKILVLEASPEQIVSQSDGLTDAQVEALLGQRRQDLWIPKNSQVWYVREGSVAFLSSNFFQKTYINKIL